MSNLKFSFSGSRLYYAGTSGLIGYDPVNSVPMANPSHEYKRVNKIVHEISFDDEVFTVVIRSVRKGICKFGLIGYEVYSEGVALTLYAEINDTEDGYGTIALGSREFLFKEKMYSIGSDFVKYTKKDFQDEYERLLKISKSKAEQFRKYKGNIAFVNRTFLYKFNNYLGEYESEHYISPDNLLDDLKYKKHGMYKWPRYRGHAFDHIKIVMDAFEMEIPDEKQE